jgi:acetyl-CoA C-acetyltransferase
VAQIKKSLFASFSSEKEVLPRKEIPMREAVICEPVRTPVGRQGGVYKDKSAVELGVAAVTGLLERTKLPLDVIEDVIFHGGARSGACRRLGRRPAD